jgi:hypothetical protein
VAIIQEYSDRTTSNIINFQPIDESFVSKHISKLNVKKATGIDGISPKLLHYAKSVVTKAITNLINLSLSKSKFSRLIENCPSGTRLQKNNSVLEKGNHRPVSVLPAIS